MEVVCTNLRLNELNPTKPSKPYLSPMATTAGSAQQDGHIVLVAGSITNVL